MQKPYKVLYVMEDFTGGGSSLALFSLIDELCALGAVEPILVAPHMIEGEDACHARGLQTIIAGQRMFIFSGNPRQPSFYLKYLPRLAYNGLSNYKAQRILADELDIAGIDIVHTNVTGVDFGARIANKAGLPHVWHLREYADHGMFSYRPGKYRYINSHATKVVAISEALKQYAIGQGVAADKISRIYDGVDCSGIPPKVRGFMADGTLRVAVVAGIHQEKGQDTVIEAIARLPDGMRPKIQADFWGTGKEEHLHLLRQKVNQYGLGTQISFRGYSRNIMEELVNYDVGILASKSEGFGRVTIEYMAAGLFVLATDGGATPELVTPGENGLLYCYGDAGALSDCLLFALGQPGRAQEMIENAAKVPPRFTPRENARAVLALYGQILGR